MLMLDGGGYSWTLRWPGALLSCASFCKGVGVDEHEFGYARAGAIPGRRHALTGGAAAAGLWTPPASELDNTAQTHTRDAGGTGAAEDAGRQGPSTAYLLRTEGERSNTALLCVEKRAAEPVCAPPMSCLYTSWWVSWKKSPSVSLFFSFALSCAFVAAIMLFCTGTRVKCRSQSRFVAAEVPRAWPGEACTRIQATAAAGKAAWQPVLMRQMIHRQREHAACCTCVRCNCLDVRIPMCG